MTTDVYNIQSVDTGGPKNVILLVPKIFGNFLCVI